MRRASIISMGFMCALGAGLSFAAPDSSLSQARRIETSGNLGYVKKSDLSLEEREALPPYCEGTFIPFRFKGESDDLAASADSASLSALGLGQLKRRVAVSVGGAKGILFSDEVNFSNASGTQSFWTNSPFTFIGEDARGTGQSLIFSRNEKLYILKNVEGFSNSFYAAADRIEVSKTQAKALNIRLSLCRTPRRTWEVRAKEMSLDNQTGRYLLFHTRLYLFGAPIFYTPLLPGIATHTNTSGFLPPILTRRNEEYIFKVPYYYSVSKTLDFTLDPEVRTRGSQLEASMRTLFPRGQMELDLGYGRSDDRHKLFDDSKEGGYEYLQLNGSYTPSFPYGSLTLSSSGVWHHEDPDVVPNGHFSYLPNNDWSRDYYRPSLAAAWRNGPLWNGNLDFSWYRPVNFSNRKNDPFYRLAPRVDLEGTLPLEGGFWLQTKLGHTRFVPIYNASQSVDRTYEALELNKTFDFEHLNASLKAGALARQYALKDMTLRAFQGAPTSFQKSPEKRSDVLNPYAQASIEIPYGGLAQGGLWSLTPRFSYLNAPHRNQESLPNLDSDVLSVRYDTLFNGDFGGLDRVSDGDRGVMGLEGRYPFERFSLMGHLAFARRFQPSRTSLLPNDPQFSWYEAYRTKKDLPRVIDFSIQSGPSLLFASESRLVSDPGLYLHQEISYFYQVFERHALQIQYERFTRGETKSHFGQIGGIERAFDSLVLFGEYGYDFSGRRYHNAMLGAAYEDCCSMFGVSFKREQVLPGRVDYSVGVIFTLKDFLTLQGLRDQFVMDAFGVGTSSFGKSMVK